MELTPEIVHELIEKIVVGKPGIQSKRYQSVEIHYNGVGIIREPFPEEMEELLSGVYTEKSCKNSKNGIANRYTV